MRIKTLLLISVIFLVTLSFAQEKDIFTQTIRGTVVAKTTQTPIMGVSIEMQGETVIERKTDLNGEFKFENVAVGRVTLYVSFKGFEPVLITDVLLTTGKEMVLNIEMDELAYILDEVNVIAKQKNDDVNNKMSSVSARSFSVKETERYAGSLGDPSRMAANFAGVSIVDDSRNDIIIRGNSPIGLLWRLDGVEVPNPNHFSAAGTTGGPVSMINNNLLANSDFFTSAFPAEYGNAMSGVFDLKLRSGNNQKREYVAQIGFNGFEFGAEGPFKKGEGSYIVNYRYSVMGLMAQLGMNSGTGDATPYYQDLSFKINLPRTKIGKISLFGIGGLSNIEIYDSSNPDGKKEDQNFTNGGSDIDFFSNMGVVGLSNLYHFNENTSLTTILSIQGTKGGTQVDSLQFDTDGKLIPNSNFRFYNSDSREIKYSASVHFKKKINRKNNYTIGAHYDLYTIKMIDSVYINSPEHVGFENLIDVNGNIPIIRAYAQWQHKFSNSLTLNTGLYSQYLDFNKEATLEPRVGLKYKLSNRQTISVGYGLHSQMQPRIYYFKQRQLSDGSYVYTNKDVKLSKSHQFVLSYDLFFTKEFRLKTELYYQNLYDIPVTHVNPAFSMLNTGTEFRGFAEDSDSLVNTGSGQNYGVEFTLEKFLSKNFYVLTTVSLFESSYKGYDKIERNTAFNNNYILNVLGGYEFKVTKHGSLSLNLKLAYAGGKRYVPIDIEASKLAHESVYNWNNAYENKHANYFRTDVKLAFKLDWRRIDHEWAINFQNITNQKNIFGESYNPQTQKIQRQYQLGFFPAFLYRITF